MRHLGQWLCIAAFAAVAGTSGTAFAADPAAGAGNKNDAVCTKCHDETENKAVLAIYQTRHGVKADARTPGCQSCHGGSDAHVKNPQGVSPRPEVDINFGPKSKTSIAAGNEACMACHETGKRMHWAGSEHQMQDIACSQCHESHAARDKVLAKVTQPEVCYTCHQTQRAQSHRISTHPLLAGKVACSDCHNPHGSTGPKLLVKNSVNETCYTCHAEKRGPFLWEHSPVTDDCMTCHTPHGSTYAPLLKSRAPWLCQDCHSGDHGAAINSGANLAGGNATTTNGLNPLGNQSPRAQTNARACLNCHVLVHGSNHPAGAKFQR